MFISYKKSGMLSDILENKRYQTNFKLSRRPLSDFHYFEEWDPLFKSFLLRQAKTIDTNIECTVITYGMIEVLALTYKNKAPSENLNLVKKEDFWISFSDGLLTDSNLIKLTYNYVNPMKCDKCKEDCHTVLIIPFRNEDWCFECWKYMAYLINSIMPKLQQIYESMPLDFQKTKIRFTGKFR